MNRRERKLGCLVKNASTKKVSLCNLTQVLRHYQSETIKPIVETHTQKLALHSILAKLNINHS